MKRYSEYLYQVANTFTQCDYRQLHEELQARYDQQRMDALLSGHPGWSVVQGETACAMMLYRNWCFSKSAAENARQFKALAAEIEANYIESDQRFWTQENVTRTMEIANQAYDLSHSIFQNQHCFIFLMTASHRTEDSFCRCFKTTQGQACVDIYLTVPHIERTATPQSILLHELGHCVNLALTGDLEKLPEDFQLVTSLIGIKQLDCDLKEFFAHCFAMSLLIEPELQKADPFCNVPQKDKQLFRTYFQFKIDRLK